MLVHEWPLVHHSDVFCSGRAISQGAVWPDGVVKDTPLLDQDLVLTQDVEAFAAERFVA